MPRANDHVIAQRQERSFGGMLEAAHGTYEKQVSTLSSAVMAQRQTVPRQSSSA